VTAPNKDRQELLQRMAAALHRAELQEKVYDPPAPPYVRLPEWAQIAYVKRADAALRVVESMRRSR
jgi:hypothetical protein